MNASDSQFRPAAAMCASAHLPLPTAEKLSTLGERHDDPTHDFDETCPEHEHQPVIAATLIAMLVMILVSVVGSLFGMA
jgi:hypothetical protein